jgi:hypothetical protein
MAGEKSVDAKDAKEKQERTQRKTKRGVMTEWCAGKRLDAD